MQLIDIIKSRRSIDPDDFNGEKVAEAIINEMLEAANWAPTHGMTEPWYFVVYAGEKTKEFGTLHSSLYKQHTSEPQFLQKKFDKIKFRSKHCSHVIVCINKRGDKSNIPEIEEIAATSCAIQNMMLIAHTHKVGTFWSTGGMCYHPEMKKALGFEEKDLVVGILYVGKYTIEHPEGKRNNDWNLKVSWK